jgi:hypothetical protein
MLQVYVFGPKVRVFGAKGYEFGEAFDIRWK